MSSLLNIAYLIPIVARGFLRPLPDGAPTERSAGEAPLSMVLPLCLTAAGCLAAFVLAQPVLELLRGITQ